MTLLISLVFGAAATAAGLLAPARMQLLIPVSSSASVAEVALPIGHWAAAAAWMAAVALRQRDNRRQVVMQGIVVAFALHVLILLALFVPRLQDRAAFSASIYLVYAQAFCAAVLAAAYEGPSGRSRSGIAAAVWLGSAGRRAGARTRDAGRSGTSRRRGCRPWV